MPYSRMRSIATVWVDYMWGRRGAVFTYLAIGKQGVLGMTVPISRG